VGIPARIDLGYECGGLSDSTRDSCHRSNFAFGGSIIMANTLSIPASRNGLPTKINSRAGVGVSPAYFNSPTGTTPQNVNPVSAFRPNQRVQLAGTKTPSGYQADVVRPTSSRQNNITAALLPVNARTSFHSAAVNGKGAISGISDIHHTATLSVRTSRGTRLGGNSPTFPTNSGGPNPITKPQTRRG
jgi:hypothetical protein